MTAPISADEARCPHIIQGDEGTAFCDLAESTVQRLSADNEKLREALRRIASEDYRGPKPHGAVFAAAALSDEGEK